MKSKKGKNMIEDHLTIKHELENLLGYGALKQIADEAGVSRSAVTRALQRRASRATSPVIEVVARKLGRTVYGVNPDGTRAD